MADTQLKIFVADQILADGMLHEHLRIVVRDGRIEQLLPASAPAPEGAEIVDLSGRIVVPGTVNVHAHAFQSLLRGFGDDLPFLEWRDRSLYRRGGALDLDGIYAGSLFAFSEMLRYGVTTVAEFFYLHGHGLEADRTVRRAAADAGIRLVLARTFYDGESAPASFRESVGEATSRCRDLMAECEDDPLVSVSPAPHSVHAASPPMIEAAHELAQEKGVALHIHVSEQPFEVEECRRQHGTTPLRWLDRLGVVDASMLLVHGCHLDPEELDMMGERGVRVAHCPNANLFLADGVADVVGMVQRGITIGLGTDGGCVNSRLSVFDEMRSAALIQKGVRRDATALGAAAVVEMGTAGGGTALGLPTGRLAAGYFADMIALDPGDPSLHPIANFPRNLVYSLSPQAISEVFVGGETVYAHGDTRRVPFAEVLARVSEVTASWSPE